MYLGVGKFYSTVCLNQFLKNRKNENSRTEVVNLQQKCVLTGFDKVLSDGRKHHCLYDKLLHLGVGQGLTAYCSRYGQRSVFG